MPFDDWMTPPEELELARLFLTHIDFDPASNAVAQEFVKAKTFGSLSAEDQKLKACIGECIGDSLQHNWSGRVWLNPPYSAGNIDAFVNKAVDSLPTIERMLVLVNSSTDTEWFHKLLANCTSVLFYRRRIKFWKIFNNKAHSRWQSATNGKIVNNPRYLNTLFMFSRSDEFDSQRFNWLYSERGTILRGKQY